MTQTIPSIAERMGDLIVDRIRAAGSYSQDDLLAAEFTEEQIKRYGSLAYGLACVKLGKASNVA
jgi:hypothetical protein